MVRAAIFLFLYCLLFCYTLSGQCPDNAFIHKRIDSLWSTNSAHSEKLKLLLAWEAGLKTCKVHDSTRAFLLAKIGVGYSYAGEFVEAIRYVRRAINLVRNGYTKPEVNPKHLTAYYYYISDFYDSLYNKSERIRALDTCVDYALKLNVVDLNLIYALFVKSKYAFSIGDYNTCIRYADMAEKSSDEFAKNDNPYRSYAHDYAMSSAAIKRNALLALDNFESVIPYFTSQIEEYKKRKANDYLGMAYGQLAEVEERRKNFESAIALYNKAFDFESKYGTTANCRSILNNMGVANVHWYNNSNLGIEYYKKAVLYRKNGNGLNKDDSVELVNAFSNLGSAYAKAGEIDSALFFIKLAFENIEPGCNENKLLNNSSKILAHFSKVQYLTNLIISKADVYRHAFKRTHSVTSAREALKVYLVADKFLFRTKTEQIDVGSKLFWRKTSRAMYENAIETCNYLRDYEHALYFFERSKAILLNDQLNEQRWTAQEDVLSQNQVKRKILQTERNLETTNRQSPAYDSIQKELFSQQQALEQLQQVIKNNNPLYYQYYLDTNSINIKDIQQKLLKDHDALIEMFSGDSSIRVLLISRDKIEMDSLDKKPFDSLSVSFVKYLSNSEMLNRQYSSFVQVSSQLHKLIFGKLNIPKGRIIISPDGKYFPFEALLTNFSNNTPHYFLDEHAVSYTYSAQFLLNDFGKVNVSSRNFMGVAPVRFASNLGLPSLPGSEESLSRLETHFSHSDNFLKENATRNNFLQVYFRYKIIQLYTHASDSGFYKEPVIYFADSALLLSDLLYENKPATNLIVLSACETGTGKLYEGEGVFGFNRGFAALGIPTSVSNLWQVENTSTYKLTELFYNYIAEGMPTDLALQKAKQEFIKTASREKQLPFYWAGPVLMGKTDAVKIERSYSWAYILGGICLIGLGFISWKYQAHRGKVQGTRKLQGLR